MSFEASATDIQLEDGHILRATVGDGGGGWVESRIDLNEFIGNEDGWFVWDGMSKFPQTFLIQPGISG
ncbi:hypothetical protein V8C37DRAFT_76305 [Trichoderma ceciliae]